MSTLCSFYYVLRVANVFVLLGATCRHFVRFIRCYMSPLCSFYYILLIAIVFGVVGSACIRCCRVCEHLDYHKRQRK